MGQKIENSGPVLSCASSPVWMRSLTALAGGFGKRHALPLWHLSGVNKTNGKHDTQR